MSLPKPGAWGQTSCTGFLLLAAALSTWSAQGAELVAPYVNTVQEDVELILDLANVGPGDYLIDLGAGDGRFVIGAALRGAAGHGVELDPALVELARRRAREAGVAERAAFHEGDIFDADIAAASVVTLYLMPEVNLRLRPKLLAELAPGTRVVSNSFDMGDWTPDARAQGRTSGGAMLWIIPARVAGRWLVTLDGHELQLQLHQRYQEVEAELARNGHPLAVKRATLRGSRLTLLARDAKRSYALHGRVNGDRIAGSAHVDGQLFSWQAARAK